MKVFALQMQLFDTHDNYDDSPFEPKRPIEVPGIWPRPGGEADSAHKDKAPHECEALTNSYDKTERTSREMDLSVLGAAPGFRPETNSE